MHHILLVEVLEHPTLLDDVAVFIVLLPQVVRAQILVELSELVQRLQHCLCFWCELLPLAQDFQRFARCTDYLGAIGQLTLTSPVLKELLA